MASGVGVPAVRTRVAARQSKVARRNLIMGVLFATPWLLHLLLFTAYPILASFYYSFTDFNALQAPAFVGLDNYSEMFTGDPLFWESVVNTIVYAAMAIPAGVVFALGLALLLNTKVRLLPFWRTIYFLPTLVPDVALGLMWLWLLNPQFGIVNWLLGMVGIQGPGWLADEYWAKPSLTLISLWGVGSTMIIYLAGLQDVPQELYDAADVDGASIWLKTRNITLPMITPVILFNLIMAVIAIFSYFTAPFVVSNGTGNPAHAMMFYAMYLYRNAFTYFRMGYASAMAWIQFIVTIIMTVIIFVTSNRWVYYGGDEKR